MNEAYLWIIGLCLLATRHVTTKPVETNFENDQILSNELWDYLTGDEHDYEDENIDYENFNYDDGQESVYVNRNKWRWTGNEIPYEFNSQDTFEDAYQSRIQSAIDYLNANLTGCINFR